MKFVVSKASFVFLLIGCFFRAALGYCDFPCNLDELKTLNSGTLPTLYLSGESHDDYHCNVDMQFHRSFAKQGHFRVALEGMEMGRKSLQSEELGYEDPLNYAISLSATYLDIITNQDSNIVDSKIPKIFKNLFKSQLRRNPYFQQNWETFKRLPIKEGAFTRDERKIINMIDYLHMLNCFDCISLIRKIHQANIANEVQVLKQFTDRFLRLFIQNYNGIYRHLPEYVRWNLEPINIDELLHPDSILLPEIRCTLRNNFMAENLAILYCDAAKKNQSLFAVMGKNHVEGIKFLLSEMSHKAVPIVERDSQSSCRNIFSASKQEDILNSIKSNYSACYSKNNENRIITSINAAAREVKFKLNSDDLVNVPDDLIPIPAISNNDIFPECGCIIQ